MCIYIYISISICSLDIHDRNDIYFRSFFVTGLAALIPQRVPKGGCIYIYMCVCVCVCLCVCARARARARACVRMRVRVCIQYVCIYVYLCIPLYILCIHFHVYMYIFVVAGLAALIRERVPKGGDTARGGGALSSDAPGDAGTFGVNTGSSVRLPSRWRRWGTYVTVYEIFIC